MRLAAIYFLCKNKNLPESYFSQSSLLINYYTILKILINIYCHCSFDKDCLNSHLRHNDFHWWFILCKWGCIQFEKKSQPHFFPLRFHSHCNSLVSMSSSSSSSTTTRMTQATRKQLKPADSRQTCHSAALRPQHGFSQFDLSGGGARRRETQKGREDTPWVSLNRTQIWREHSRSNR